MFRGNLCRAIKRNCGLAGKQSRFQCFRNPRPVEWADRWSRGTKTLAPPPGGGTAIYNPPINFRVILLATLRHVV